MAFLQLLNSDDKVCSLDHCERWGLKNFFKAIIVGFVTYISITDVPADTINSKVLIIDFGLFYDMVTGIAVTNVLNNMRREIYT
jgi:hypothetical protein